MDSYDHFERGNKIQTRECAMSFDFSNVCALGVGRCYDKSHTTPIQPCYRNYQFIFQQHQFFIHFEIKYLHFFSIKNTRLICNQIALKSKLNFHILIEKISQNIFYLVEISLNVYHILNFKFI